MGRVSSKWTGTTDTHTGSEWTPSSNTGNMIKTEDDQYDSGGMGDGNLTQVTQHVDTSSSDDRVTQYLYDWRDRKVVSKSGVQSSEDSTTHRPIAYTHYDNLGEVTESDNYDGDTVSLSGLGSTSGVPNAPTSSLLRSKSTSSYDDQGRVYESATYSVDQSSGTVGNALTTDTFYDHRGQTIATFSPGSQVSKSVYDGAGRVTTQYTTDGGAVNNSGSQQKDWTHAGSVSTDVVLTQSENTYDADGNVLLTLTRDRFHDDATSSQGGLGAVSSGIHARVSYMASYYDAADRLTDSVNVGTNGGSSYTRPGTVPSASDTVLVTHTDYNAAGRAYLITDPRGILSATFYDMLGRTTSVVNDATSGSPTAGTQVTGYTYDGAGHTLTMTAHNGSDTQVTAYLYGVGGTIGTNLFSKDLIAQAAYPNASTGVADTSTSGSASYTYNLLGQQTTMTDQNGNVHSYVYDALGRQKQDIVTTLASGVDGSVLAHETRYDTGGRPYLFTSYSDTSCTTVVNQVEDLFNGLGQLVTEYQAYGGAVNTSSSPKVQYNYTEMSGSENNSRLRSMVYPNGRVLDYQYSSAQEPVSGITSTTTTATATTVVAHGLSMGDKVMIEGAGSHYDGLVTVASVPTSTTFTFTISSFTGSSSGTDITEAKFGIDNSISRVSGLQDRAGTSAGTVLEGYSYLGLGTIIIRNRPEDSTQLTYVQQSGDANANTDGGDQYTGLDRFGRVIDQYWLNTSTSTAVDRFQYGYDPDGNVLYKNNLVHSSLSELYHANSAISGDNASAYDKLNRLTGFSVGTLSSSGHNGSGLDTVSSLNTTPHIYQETWTLDALGNWSSLAKNGASAVGNSFDKRNRETGFQGNTLSFDNNGNTTVDQAGQHYTYDAWNKVTTIKNSAQTIILLSETHDALGRVATFDNTNGLQHWYYSNQNQVLEDQFSSIRQQYVWGQGYVNDLVLRDRNTDSNTSTGAYGKASSGLEERLYSQQDANYNVTTIIDPSQSIKERFVYDPYGGFTNLDSSWAAYTDTTWLWSYKFQGTYWEGIAGFYYMGARIYSPALGRFLQEDPKTYVDGGNVYQFARSSPVLRRDPSGLSSADPSEALVDQILLTEKLKDQDWNSNGGHLSQHGEWLWQHLNDLERKIRTIPTIFMIISRDVRGFSWYETIGARIFGGHEFVATVPQPFSAGKIGFGMTNTKARALIDGPSSEIFQKGDTYTVAKQTARCSSLVEGTLKESSHCKNSEIAKAIGNHKADLPYNTVGYNCQDWAWAAVTQGGGLEVNVF